MVMKKLLAFALSAVLALLPCAALAETRTGTAKGFGGDVTVRVTVEDGVITAVEAEGAMETNGVGSLAIEQLPAAIVQAGSAEVDGVTGATYTSNAVKEAARSALNPDAIAARADAAPAADEGVSLGVGVVSSGRVGPGKDDTDTQVYSFNQVIASVLFDAEGRVLLAHIDDVEVATPNYDGAGMPHFSGFPGQGGYNNDENHDEKVDGKIEPTQESFLTELAGWTTKRDRGDGYRLNSGSWAQEMDIYQTMMRGKTVEEIRAWFAKYCSDRNGRPLQANSENEEDAAKYDALSDADKTMLADAVSGATMSLSDAHGDIVGAVEKAYANRYAIDLTVTD